MKIEYVEDTVLGLDDTAHTYLLPKCPYCGERLEYPEENEQN